jgi:hypothetical protein
MATVGALGGVILACWEPPVGSIYFLKPANLDKLRVVDIIREGINYGIEVHLVAVCRKLHAVRQAPGNILKELGSKPRISPSNHPTDNQLRLRFDGNKRPSVASDPLSGDLRRHVLLLTANKTPDLVNLNPLGGNVSQGDVEVFGARRADRLQQAKYGAFGNARHANGGANRAPFDPKAEITATFFSMLITFAIQVVCDTAFA